MPICQEFDQKIDKFARQFRPSAKSSYGCKRYGVW